MTQENQLYLPRRQFKSDDSSHKTNIRALESWAEAPKDAINLVDKVSLPDSADYRDGSIILVGDTLYQNTATGFVAMTTEGISKTLVDAKGDLLLGTANDAVGRKAVGANGTMLVANSAETTGVEWRVLADGDIPAAIARDAEVTSAIATHEADTTNVHGIADTTVLATDAEVTAAIDAHKADASDMHPQYQKESEKGAASGYAALDADKLIQGQGVERDTDAARFIKWGTGTPEGVVTASVGSIFLRTDGGAGTVLYVKETGAADTGWVAK